MKQVEYQERFGAIRFPDGFAEELRGKSIEEQIACYAAAGAELNEMSYHMADVQSGEMYDPLHTEYYDVIVKDGLVVGFMSGRRALLPYSYVYTSGSASDNNGAGYKYSDGTDFYLICVPSDLSRPVCVYPPFGTPIHTLTVPVTEAEYDVELPEEFLAQIKGKSIAEQLDYYWVLDGADEIKPIYLADPSVYQKRWSTRCFPNLLRYDPNLEEIFVKDGVIVAVAYRSSYPRYGFEKRIVVKVGEITKISEWFEDKWEDTRVGFFRDYTLQPILYR